MQIEYVIYVVTSYVCTRIKDQLVEMIVYVKWWLESYSYVTKDGCIIGESRDQVMQTDVVLERNRKNLNHTSTYIVIVCNIRLYVVHIE